MKSSMLSLIYLMQGIRTAGIEIDQKLEYIALSADILDLNFIIYPCLEG